MRNIFKKFIKEKKGNVVQYIIVLSIAIVIFVFFFQKEKDAMKNTTNKTMNDITNVQSTMS